MRNFIYTILFILFTAPVIAQHSGYLGKKFIIHYDHAMSVSINNPTKKTKSDIPAGVNDANAKLLSGFNRRHNFEFEWLINKKYSIGAVFHNLKTKSEEFFDFKHATPSNFYDFENGKTTLTATDAYIFANIKANSFGVSATIYPDFMSPIGTYFKLELFRTNYKTDVIHELVENSNSDGNRYVESETIDFYKDSKYFTYGAVLHLGKQKVYFNRITMRYGVQMGYIFDSSYKTSLYNTNNVIFYTSNKRLRNHYIWNCNLGIGYLF